VPTGRTLGGQGKGIKQGDKENAKDRVWFESRPTRTQNEEIIDLTNEVSTHTHTHTHNSN